MKNSFTLLSLLSLFIIRLDAQYLDLDWVKQQGGSQVDVAYSITIDPTGNVLTVGNFSTTADFDPGPGVFNMTAGGSMDAYISKLDPSGNLLWAKRMGGSSFSMATDVATDVAGYIYLCGEFQGNIDVDPGPAVVNFIAPGRDVFFVKLDPSGNFIWGKHLTGSPTIVHTRSLSLVNDQDVFIAGDFSYTMDIDPGAGIYNLTASGSGGLADAFIAKYDSAGNFVWAKQIGGVNADRMNDLCLDSFGNLLMSGGFQGTVDFDPGTGTYNQTSFGIQDGFILKLDNSGNFIWVKQFGDTDFTGVDRMELDISGNIFFGGFWYSSVDLDPGPGSFHLNTFGGSDFFVAKLDPSGNFLWAGQFGGTGADVLMDLHLNDGKIYLAGIYESTADMDPGPGIFNITSLGSRDMFIAALNSSGGSFITAKSIAGPGGFDVLHRAVMDPSGNLYITGLFDITADFNPCIGSTILTGLSTEIFTAKYHLKTAAVSISATSTIVCPTRPVTFTASPVDAGPIVFQWQVNGVNVGTNSPVYTTTTLVDGDIVSVIMSSTCNVYPPLQSNQITMTDDPEMPSAIIVADNTVICSGSSVNFSAVPTNGGSTPTYQWQVNGVNVGPNSPVFSYANFTNGDMVRVMITSSDPCAAPGAFPSNAITITVNPNAIPAVTINADDPVICPGGRVNFTAVPVNGGPAPVFQWQVNGVNVGTSVPVYSSNTLVQGDSVHVIMTSSANCVLPGGSPSNKIGIRFIQNVASVQINLYPSKICFGTPATFIASSVNEGNQPFYQWKLNGAILSVTGANYRTDSLNDGDKVECILTSNAACLVKQTDTSNVITVKIDPAVCPLGFYMPNAFTPNNDGRNDWCRPLLFGKVVAYQFSLYNRWGQKIFETNELQKGWDGTIAGALQQTGTFVWFCNFQFKDQPAETRKGTVTLIR